MKLGNSINFTLSHKDHPENNLGGVELSMIADISKLKKGKEKDIPIHMMVSQEDKGVDVVGQIRKIEGKAEIRSKAKVRNIEDFIEQIRYDKRQGNKTLEIKEDHNRIKQLARTAIDDTVSLRDRQKALNTELKTTTVPIPWSILCEQEMEAKIYNYLTRGQENKEAQRLKFGAEKVVEYVSNLENIDKRGQKASEVAVSKILSSLVEGDQKKKTIQKHASLILRQVIDSHNLSLVDKVKKVLDTVTITLMIGRKDVKEIVGNVKLAKKSPTRVLTFQERVKSEVSTSTSLRPIN